MDDILGGSLAAILEFKSTAMKLVNAGNKVFGWAA